MVLKAREVGRAIGINRWIASYLLGGRGYEARYCEELCNFIRPGDCVWDVGANIGYYTKIFAQRVGSQGIVFAFEPSPVNYRRLCEHCASLEHVKLLPYGLGKSDDTVHFKQAEDDLGATSRVTQGNDSEMIVEIRSGDSLIASGTANVPHVVKIDVEGYEWEVLEGMRDVLKQSELGTIGIEVHFGILHGRGMRWVPRQIEQLLCDAGFSLTWPDFSHVVAVRNSSCSM